MKKLIVATNKAIAVMLRLVKTLDNNWQNTEGGIDQLRQI
jgi:hypothetical protein